MEQRYRISELADKAGVTKRTVHYYISKGLIPPPEGAGVSSTYDEEHLVKVLLIKRLQERYLPLEKIRHIVSGISLESARELLNNQDTEPEQQISQTGDVSEKNEQLISETQHYGRIDLGMGIELHYPVSSAAGYPDIIRSIEKYAKKLIEER